MCYLGVWQIIDHFNTNARGSETSWENVLLLSVFIVTMKNILQHVHVFHEIILVYIETVYCYL